MFVCICNQVNDKQIRRAVAEGVRSMESLSTELNVGTSCGKCRGCAKKILNEAVQENMSRQTFPDAFVLTLAPA